MEKTLNLKTVEKCCTSSLIRDEADIAIKALKHEYARKLALFEFETMSGGREIGESADKTLRDWSMSTRNKRQFFVLCTIATMHNHYKPTSELLKLLGISRAALDTMIADCEAEGWINVKRNKQGHRRVQATEIAVQTWFEYSNWIKEKSFDYKFHHLHASIVAMREILESK